MRRLGLNITGIANKMVSPDRGVPTGFTDLDAMTLGMTKQEYIVVAGRPSMGKTSFLMQMAWQMEKPVLVMSAEMSEQAIGERFITQMSQVGLHKVRGRRSNNTEKEKLKQTIRDLSTKPLYIDDTANMTPDTIRKSIKKFADEVGHSPECVFVDYLQLLSIDNVYGGEREKITAISKELKAIAKEADLPLVVASQLNRANEQREDKTPKMSDLRGSGSIEQDADVILMLHRPSYYRITEDDPDSVDDGETKLFLSKNRNGPVGKLEYIWNKECMSFNEVSTRYKEFGA